MRQPINTKKLIEKIEKFANDISSEKGPFILFGLFQREKLINSWDLVICASWLKLHDFNVLKYIENKLRYYIEEDERLSIGRLVTISQDNPWISEVLAIPKNKKGITELRNSELFGHNMRQAFIIKSQ
ncbi:hypothetical protein MHK_001231 [Candidatus Magnetomorum sp. HK-1]|nr:hypothetical protein MHK_001231 [Candidatus Magnetomorum sp. HK-1]